MAQTYIQEEEETLRIKEPIPSENIVPKENIVEVDNNKILQEHNSVLQESIEKEGLKTKQTELLSSGLQAEASAFESVNETIKQHISLLGQAVDQENKLQGLSKVINGNINPLTINKNPTNRRY